LLPSPLDCESLAPFDVFRIPFQFDGDPESIPKLFVVALNVSSVGLIRCFKPTSQEQNFLGDEFVLKGVVHYLKGEVDFFHADHTFISPEVYAIPTANYAFIRSTATLSSLDVCQKTSDRGSKQRLETNRNGIDVTNWNSLNGSAGCFSLV